MKEMVIAVDIDGTLAEYDGWKGWQHIGGPITDKNGMTAQEFMNELKSRGHTLILHSTRGSEQVEEWATKHDIPYDYINVNPEIVCNNLGKPLANAYLDDRGIQFRGDFRQALRDIENFVPWCGAENVVTSGGVVVEKMARKDEESLDEAFGEAFKEMKKPKPESDDPDQTPQD